jgi:hypothetical protein
MLPLKPPLSSPTFLKNNLTNAKHSIIIYGKLKSLYKQQCKKTTYSQQ